VSRRGSAKAAFSFAGADGTRREGRAAMSDTKTRAKRFAALAVVIVGYGMALYAAGAQTGFRRTDLVKQDLAAPGREVVQARVSLDPGVVSPTHWHPGEEVAYVLEGELEYTLEGKPPVVLRAGDALFIPAGAVHSARNVGKTVGTELATYIVEKGKPLLVIVK
jgi:quercetin dioxygenase-like cupin family protein